MESTGVLASALLAAESSFSRLPRSLSPYTTRNRTRHLSLMTRHTPKAYRAGILFLKQLFRQLASSSNDGNQTIDKETLLKYLPLPGLLGERLFTVFDHDGSGGIDFYEFVAGLTVVYGGTLEEKKRFLFEMYDLDGNGRIEREELRTLLSHIPAAFKISRTLDPGNHDLKDTYLDDTEALFREVQLKKKIDDIVNTTFDDIGANKSQISGVSPASSNTLSPSSASHTHVAISEGLTYDEFVTALNKSKEISEVLNLFYVGAMPHLPVPHDILDFAVLRQDGEFGKRFRPSSHFSKAQTGLHLEQGNSSMNLPSQSSMYSVAASSEAETSVISSPGTPVSNAVRNTPRIRCPMCHHELELIHCPGCGSKLETKTKGSIKVLQCLCCSWNVGDLKFCFYCGQPLRFQLASLSHMANLASDAYPTISETTKASESSLKSTSGAGGYAASTPSAMKQAPRLFQFFKTRLEAPRESYYATNALMRGYLYKVGRRLGMMIKRYYVLKDRFLYTLKKCVSENPMAVNFLPGACVNAVTNSTVHGKYGFEIVLGNSNVRALYASSIEERDLWVEVLNQATKNVSIHDYYTLQERIGRGEFSAVHRAVSKTTQADVAVKVLSKANLSSEDREFRRNEVSVLKLMNHSNVVRLLDIFDTVSYLYLVMEYLPFGNLKNVIKYAQGPLSENLVRHIITQVLKGVAYIHSRGIIHRDLKPENILVSPNCELLEDSAWKLIGVNKSKLLKEKNPEAILMAVNNLFGCKYLRLPYEQSNAHMHVSTIPTNTRYWNTPPYRLYPDALNPSVDEAVFVPAPILKGKDFRRSRGTHHVDVSSCRRQNELSTEEENYGERETGKVEEFPGGADMMGVDYLSRISLSSKNMTGMVDGLLEDDCSVGRERYASRDFLESVGDASGAIMGEDIPENSSSTTGNPDIILTSPNNSKMLVLPHSIQNEDSKLSLNSYSEKKRSITQENQSTSRAKPGISDLRGSRYQNSRVIATVAPEPNVWCDAEYVNYEGGRAAYDSRSWFNSWKQNESAKNSWGVVEGSFEKSGVYSKRTKSFSSSNRWSQLHTETSPDPENKYRGWASLEFLQEDSGTTPLQPHTSKSTHYLPSFDGSSSVGEISMLSERDRYCEPAYLDASNGQKLVNKDEFSVLKNADPLPDEQICLSDSKLPLNASVLSRLSSSIRDYRHRLSNRSKRNKYRELKRSGNLLNFQSGSIQSGIVYISDIRYEAMFKTASENSFRFMENRRTRLRKGNSKTATSSFSLFPSFRSASGSEKIRPISFRSMTKFAGLRYNQDVVDRKKSLKEEPGKIRKEDIVVRNSAFDREESSEATNPPTIELPLPMLGPQRPSPKVHLLKNEESVSLRPKDASSLDDNIPTRSSDCIADQPPSNFDRKIPSNRPAESLPLQEESHSTTALTPSRDEGSFILMNENSEKMQLPSTIGSEDSSTPRGGFKLWGDDAAESLISGESWKDCRVSSYGFIPGGEVRTPSSSGRGEGSDFADYEGKTQLDSHSGGTFEDFSLGETSPNADSTKKKEGSADYNRKMHPTVTLPKRFFLVKIADFGLSKLIAPTVKTNEPLGTVAYAAPEVLRGENYEKNVDVWSIGILTYELLSGGELPFPGISDNAIVKCVLTNDISLDSEHIKHVSREGKDFLRHLLTWSSYDRPTPIVALLHPWLSGVR